MYVCMHLCIVSRIWIHLLCMSYLDLDSKSSFCVIGFTQALLEVGRKSLIHTDFNSHVVDIIQTDL